MSVQLHSIYGELSILAILTSETRSRLFCAGSLARLTRTLVGCQDLEILEE